MQKANSSQKVILTYSFFVALCSLLLLRGMFQSPSEVGNSIIFGLSLSRLIVAIGFLLVIISFAALFWKAFKDQGWAERFLEQWFGGGRFSKGSAWIASIGFGLGWIGCFLPAYRTGMLGPNWNRIQPIMSFILTASIATLAVFLIRRSGFSIQSLKTPAVFRLGLILFLVSLPVLVLMLTSKYDAHRLEDFWYGAGVPILASQLVVTVLGGILFLLFKKESNFKRFDVVVFILLYVITALLWAHEPLERSFMFTGPYAPNKVLYPFADAANFDTASQFGLIGQGIYIFNTPFFERTLYISFLIYLHSLFGQNYDTLMAAQAVIFAVFPPLIYLIGRSLNMRAVGFVAAIIALFRGINSIAASNMTDTASPKMILTDFPTAIGIALIILFACKWLKEPRQNWIYALWVGGAVGLTMMLRTNALVFLLLIPLYAILKYAPQWKNWLIASALMVLAVIAITLPWELRNVSRGAMLYSPIVTKIRDVIRARYPVPSGSLSPQDEVLSLTTFQQTKSLSLLYSARDAQAQACQTIACFAPKHFIHDVITSILILPTSPALDDLRHTIKESNPYWRADWNGHLTLPALFFFALSVFFIALGISVAWKQQRLSGLVPCAVFVFYNLSNAFARTSGGRYVVPIDWIMSFYFAVGILFLIKETADVTNIRLGYLFDPKVENDETPLPRSAWSTAIVGLLLLFAIGALVPLSEQLYAPRYTDFDFTKALQEHDAKIASAGLTLTQINDFLQTPGSELLVGRTLYPRSFKLGQGEFAFYPYTVMGFPRTDFVLIGPKGADGIVLPGDFPKYFPHATDALVIGCRGQNYVDALAVILLDAREKVYVRSPLSELTCPLKEPVCENNSVCK